MTSTDGWVGPTLSDRVAERIIAFRKRPSINLTREQLAQRCAEAGAPWLTFSTLTNIETGRRKDGARRRDITIDELVIIARAMRVPPILLIFPLGIEQEIEILPKQNALTEAAMNWFEGTSPYPVHGDPGGGPIDGITGLREWYDSPDPGWEVVAAPVTLFAEHRRLHEMWTSASTRAYSLFIDRDEASNGPEMEATALRWRTEAERGLQRVRAEMRRHGLTPPRLPEYLQHITEGEQS